MEFQLKINGEQLQKDWKVTKKFKVVPMSWQRLSKHRELSKLMEFLMLMYELKSFNMLIRLEGKSLKSRFFRLSISRVILSVKDIARILTYELNLIFHCYPDDVSSEKVFCLWFSFRITLLDDFVREENFHEKTGIKFHSINFIFKFVLCCRLELFKTVGWESWTLSDSSNLTAFASFFGLHCMILNAINWPSKDFVF